MAKIHSKQIQVDSFSDSATIEQKPNTSQLQVMDSGISAAKLASDAVETAKIKDANVTTAKLADGSVLVGKLADDAVETAKIKDGNVSTAKLADGAVLVGKLADDAVETAKIKDGNVTTDKLDAAAVTTAKIANDAVDNTKLKLDDDYAFTGAIQVPVPTAAAHAVRKSYVDDLINGLAWEEPILALAPESAPTSPSAGDRYLVLGTARSWAGNSTQSIVEYDGSSWAADSDVEQGSAVLNREEGIIYVKGSSSWVQASMPTDYAFGNGLMNSNGVVDIQLASSGGLIIDSSGSDADKLKINANGVSRDMIADFSAQGSIMRGGSGGAVQDLAKGSEHHVLMAGAADIEYALIDDDNIASNAGIAISKLAARQISGKNLGTDLDSLTALAGGGLELSGAYNGGAAQTVAQDWKRVMGFITSNGFSSGSISGTKEGMVQSMITGSMADLEADEVSSSHPVYGLQLFRNGVLYTGERVTSMSSSTQAGKYMLSDDGNGKLKLTLMEGVGTGAEDFTGDDWMLFVTVER